MYPRANKAGSVVRYLALAHNERVGAATRANVLLNLTITNLGRDLTGACSTRSRPGRLAPRRISVM